MMEPHQITACAGMVGIAAGTIFVGMNTTINSLVMPTLFLGGPCDNPSRASPDFMTLSTSTTVTSAAHLNRQWQEVYKRGIIIGPSSAVISGICYLAAAYYSPVANDLARQPFGRSPGPFSLVRQLYVAGSVISLSIPMYTFFAMMSTNNELNRRGDELSMGKVKPERVVGEEATATVTLVKKWTCFSKIRVLICLASVGCGAAAHILGVSCLRTL